MSIYIVCLFRIKVMQASSRIWPWSCLTKPTLAAPRLAWVIAFILQDALSLHTKILKTYLLSIYKALYCRPYINLWIVEKLNAVCIKTFNCSSFKKKIMVYHKKSDREYTFVIHFEAYLSCYQAFIVLWGVLCVYS